ncbi:MAG TPA: ABC transporter permease [Vicinamibacterales bacterium]|nr:ABC transporter permease [Vicinamibacterales bacterium]
MVADQMTSHAAARQWALRAYRAALVVLPRRMRRRYADDMQATFAARCDAAAAAGSLAIASVFARELADLLVAAVRARRAPRRSTSVRSISRRNPMTSLAQDLRYAFRMLRRQPGFAAVTVATLALGIGATTAVFTVVNGVLLRPLAYADPDRLLLLLNGRPGRISTAFSPPNYRDITTESGVFSVAAAFDGATVTLTGEGDPLRVQSAEVTGGFFATLGVQPRYGRLIDESEIAAGRRSVVLGDVFWRRQFGGRSDVVGRSLRIDGRLYEVIGIAPPDVTLPGTPDLWRPLLFSPAQLSDDHRGAQWVGVVGRLKPGIALGQANAALAVVAERLARAYPRVNDGRQMLATPLQERIVSGIRPALLVLLGAVSLVLLIACVNVANLLLARSGGRSREVAVRTAVGAGRGRLIRQFLAESVALGGIGAAAGLLVAWAVTRALVALGPASIPRLADVAIDGRVLAFAVALALATSVLFGLAPALTTSGASLSRAIAGGRGAIGASSTRTRKVLVAAELALAVVLLIGAALLVRSYERLSAVDPGFASDHVLTFHISLPDVKYTTAASVFDTVSAYLQRLGGTPGVERAAAVFGLPLDDFTASTSFTRSGEADTADAPSAGMRVVSPDYFATLKIPLRAGRLFDARDDSQGTEVVLINEEAVRRFWPNQNPLGQQIKVAVRLASGVRSGPKTIVGVVGDVKYRGLDLTAPPEIYLPYAQQPVDTLTIALRTRGEPLSLVPTARAALVAIDRDLAIDAVHTMEDLVGRSIAERRFTTLLLAAFATVAVLLAAVGVYGVLAYLVTQRTQEIGVRLAMGAAPGDVVRLFVREGCAVATTGVALGLASALAAARALTSLVFGVTTSDPLTFFGVAAALAIVAVVASYVPARRAARVDPMTALRAE